MRFDRYYSVNNVDGHTELYGLMRSVEEGVAFLIEADPEGVN